MPAPDLAVLAEGDLSTGEHWILRAGGTSTDFYTFLETVHPDGHRDQGGMAHKARSSNHRIWPGTRQPGSASCGGTAARRLEHPVQPGWGPHPGPPPADDRVDGQRPGHKAHRPMVPAVCLHGRSLPVPGDTI